MQEKNMVEEDVLIPCGDIELKGRLALHGETGEGIVLFAHGSGSGRKSPRNLFVAERLQRFGLSALLFDLLSEDEEVVDLWTSHLRFDISLLARRLELVTQWIMRLPLTQDFNIGYFGASTGAGAALVAAAALGDNIKAIVSRGGRPDLASIHLSQVSAPTLLVVGSKDEHVIKLNREAMAKMRPGLARLEIVPGASHLFEEAGTLERVTELAAGWFAYHLMSEGPALRMSDPARDDEQGISSL